MTFRRLAVALLTVTASAVPALAQPGEEAQGPVTHTDQLVVVTPNAPIVISNGAPSQVAPVQAMPVGGAPSFAAPQNEPWDNVSHINGQLVKVGERGDYLIKYKKFNVSTNPIGWMFGIYGVSMSEAVSQNVAIRADANLINFEGLHGYELGISAPIYFKRVYSGPFIEPGLITRGSSETYDDCSDCGSSSAMVGPEVLFGWSWIFDSGLNVTMAFGAARDMSSSSDHSDPEPAGYFRIGYAM